MAGRRARTQDVTPATPRRPPATTPDARENQMIALADGLAERQLREGTAAAQVITHYLKLGSSRERLEQERLRNENILLQAKKEQMDSQAKIEQMYGEALNAMRSYAGHAPLQLESEDDFYDD